MDVSGQAKDDKIEFLVIGSRQQLLKIHHCSVRVGAIDIKPVKVARNLGAWVRPTFFYVDPYFYVL